MSSANNAVGAMAAYFVQGTAATNVSTVTGKDTKTAAGASFDMVLNKVSGSLIQNKTADVSKQVNQSLDNSKQTESTDLTAKADTSSVSTDKAQADNTQTQEVKSTVESQNTVVTNETQGTEADTKLQES